MFMYLFFCLSNYFMSEINLLAKEWIDVNRQHLHTLYTVRVHLRVAFTLTGNMFFVTLLEHFCLSMGQ